MSKIQQNYKQKDVGFHGLQEGIARKRIYNWHVKK